MSYALYVVVRTWESNTKTKLSYSFPRKVRKNDNNENEAKA